jgi:hypothetical protein
VGNEEGRTSWAEVRVAAIRSKMGQSQAAGCLVKRCPRRRTGHHGGHVA